MDAMSTPNRKGRVVLKSTTRFIPRLHQYRKSVHKIRPMTIAIRPGIPAAFFKNPKASSGFVMYTANRLAGVKQCQVVI